MTKAMRGKRLRTTVFRSGNSQAVRIPAAFRVESGNAVIEQVPEGLLLRPVEENFGDVIARLREFQKENGIDEDLIDELTDLPVDPVPEIDRPAERDKGGDRND